MKSDLELFEIVIRMLNDRDILSNVYLKYKDDYMYFNFKLKVMKTPYADMKKIIEESKLLLKFEG